MLPIDGDYPGGRTGIGIDTYPEYLGLDTAHGVTPYFGDPSVVTNPNALDFPGGFARRSRMTGLRQMALAEDEAAEGEAAEGGEEGEQAASGPSRRAGGIYSYGPYSEVHIHSACRFHASLPGAGFSSYLPEFGLDITPQHCCVAPVGVDGVVSGARGKQVPVSTRPDAACYRCIQQAKSDDWQLYSACSGVCEVTLTYSATHRSWPPS